MSTSDTTVRAGHGDPPLNFAGRETPARRGFRPAARSRARIAIGVLVSLAAIGAILLIFATLDKRVAVLQLTRDVPAGEQITADDLRVIELSVDSSLEVVDAADRAVVIGRYAKVRMVAGTLLAAPSLQSTPLVSPGSSVVAITVAAGELPVGLRERSQLQLVFPLADSAAADAVAAAPVLARAVGLPTSPDSVTGSLSLSVEVAAAAAQRVAAAKQVRVVLLEPGTDPAGQP